MQYSIQRRCIILTIDSVLLLSVKTDRVGVLAAGGGQVDKEAFIRDFTKESRKGRRVGASYRWAAGIMEDGKLWLQVKLCGSGTGKIFFESEF